MSRNSLLEAGAKSEGEVTATGFEPTTSLKNKEMEPVEPVQKNIYQSNTYRTDLSWLHFDNEPRVQER